MPRGSARPSVSVLVEGGDCKGQGSQSLSQRTWGCRINSGSPGLASGPLPSQPPPDLRNWFGLFSCRRGFSPGEHSGMWWDRHGVGGRIFSFPVQAWSSRPRLPCVVGDGSGEGLAWEHFRAFEELEPKSQEDPVTLQASQKKHVCGKHVL